MKNIRALAFPADLKEETLEKEMLKKETFIKEGPRAPGEGSHAHGRETGALASFSPLTG